MKWIFKLPLLAKVLIWLCLHLMLLAFGFMIFINWQLGLGLDSLLSGSAGEKLKSFGDEVVTSLVDIDQDQWDQQAMLMASEKGLKAHLVFSQAGASQYQVPDNVSDLVSNILPPQPPPHPGSNRGPIQRSPSVTEADSEGAPPDDYRHPYAPRENSQDGTEAPPRDGGQGRQRPYPPPHMRQGSEGSDQGFQRPLPPHMRQGDQTGQFGRPLPPHLQQGGQGNLPPHIQQGGQADAPANQRFRAHDDMHPAVMHGMGRGGDIGQVPNSQMAASIFSPETRPLFLVRGDDGDGYWAGVSIHFPPLQGMPMHPALLLIRSERLDGEGMFFDFKPWLRGGIAVLVLSFLIWMPFVLNITRYLRKLTTATDQIAAGRFQVTVPARGGDELGTLGETIRTMSARLDQMVSGQKRFLADAAHELCGPLARVRTGLGIMEARMEGADASALRSIEADASELAELVDEVLAFSRAGRRKAIRKRVDLRDVTYEAIDREGSPCRVNVEVPEKLVITTDPALVGRAVGNLIRNASIHAGNDVTVTVLAEEKGDMVYLRIQDDGPGVPPEELENLFQPFYRLDESRSRDSGGSGLGLAIVRTSIESCGGEVKAYEAPSGGFGVLIRLPKTPSPSTNE